MESDYAATCSGSRKNYLEIDKLQLQGCFEQEYDQMDSKLREANFKIVVSQLKSVMTLTKPRNFKQLLDECKPCTNREEYFARTRFNNPW